MSYCRWSSMNFACDLFVYGSSFGYTVHVAEMRFRDTSQLPEAPDPFLPYEEWFHLNAERDAIFDTLVSEKIDLPHAGETFTLDTLSELRDRLVELRGLGYRFPDAVLEMIDDEEEKAQQ